MISVSKCRFGVTIAITVMAADPAAGGVTLDEAYDLLKPEGCTYCHIMIGSKKMSDREGPSIDNLRRTFSRDFPDPSLASDKAKAQRDRVAEIRRMIRVVREGEGKHPPAPRLNEFEAQNLCLAIVGMTPMPNRPMQSRTGKPNPPSGGSPGPTPAPTAVKRPPSPSCVAIREEYDHSVGRNIVGWFTNNCGECVVATWKDAGSAGYVSDHVTRLDGGVANHREAFPVGSKGNAHFLVTRVEWCQ